MRVGVSLALALILAFLALFCTEPSKGAYPINADAGFVEHPSKAIARAKRPIGWVCVYCGRLGTSGEGYGNSRGEKCHYTKGRDRDCWFIRKHYDERFDLTRSKAPRWEGLKIERPD